MNRTLLLTLVIPIVALASAAAADGPSPNDQARFLAGMPVRGSALEAISRGKEYVDHASSMDSAWSKMESRQLSRVRAWSRAYLPDAHTSSAAVFYTFSGPDFVYPHTIFPNSSLYIMCGTEPVGAVPDITRIPPPVLDAALANLRKSLNTMLSFHYFITKDMRVDLSHNELGGTLPLLYVFLARSGCTIRDVDVSGSSVEITFNAGAGRSQKLIYFKTDLSNGGSNGAFFNFCSKNAPGLSLVKSASYLMHTDGFSKVRNFLLNNSRIIVEDDSGIPLRYFDPNKWELQFFGSYKQPIEIFRQYTQPDLAAIYGKGGTPALGFGFGYDWHPARGHVIVARPK